MNMFSVTPATDSRLNVNRGLGHRPAARASARATSTPLRISRTRGLSALSLASASASVRTVWAAAGVGRHVKAAATHQVRVRIRLLPTREISRRGYRAVFMRRARKAGREGRKGREGGRESGRRPLSASARYVLAPAVRRASSIKRSGAARITEAGTVKTVVRVRIGAS